MSFTPFQPFRGFGGGAAPFSPLSLSPVMWLKADTLGLSDGTGVATWTDSSGNGNHAVQANASKQPQYKTAQINGLPVVRFDGNDDEMSFPLISQASLSTVIVCRWITFKNYGSVLGDASGSEQYMRTLGTNEQINTNGAYFNSFYSNGVIVSGVGNFANPFRPPGGTMATFRVYSMPYTAATAFSLKWLGRSENNMVQWWHGEIAEVICTQKVGFTAADRQNLERYLGTKYGISVA